MYVIYIMYNILYDNMYIKNSNSNLLQGLSAANRTHL